MWWNNWRVQGSGTVEPPPLYVRWRFISYMYQYTHRYVDVTVRRGLQHLQEVGCPQLLYWRILCEHSIVWSYERLVCSKYSNTLYQRNNGTAGMLLQKQICNGMKCLNLDLLFITLLKIILHDTVISHFTIMRFQSFSWSSAGYWRTTVTKSTL